MGGDTDVKGQVGVGLVFEAGYRELDSNSTLGRKMGY